MPSYEEMYQRMLELKRTSNDLILPYPIEQILRATARQDVLLSEHDKTVRDLKEAVVERL